MTAPTLIRGDARNLALADASVDLIVTSPPYFALRSYTDGGEHYAAQIGSEATPADHIASLVECTREWMRVLKPSGSIWVNLGDKYSTGNSGQSGMAKLGEQYRGGGHSEAKAKRGSAAIPGMRPKSLIGLPWRYALACIDELGLILRAEVIWDKPNSLPESVTDRVRRSHEQWFHLQTPLAGDRVELGAERFPFCPLCGRPTDARSILISRLHELESRIEDPRLSDEVWPDKGVQNKYGGRAQQPAVVSLRGSSVPLAVPGDGHGVQNTRNLLDDETVSVIDHHSQVRATSAPMAEGHAALAVDDPGEPGKVCSCSHPLIIDDEPWIPQSIAAEIMQSVADGQINPQTAADFLSGDYARTHSTWFHLTKQPRYFSAVDKIREQYAPGDQRRSTVGTLRSINPSGQSGAAVRHESANPLGKLPGSVWTIASQPLTVPKDLGIDHFAAFPMEWPRRIILGWSPPGGVILDPFGGTGTTALVASVLGRRGISVDMSADYCRLAQWRTTDPKQLERASRPAKSRPKPAVEPTPRTAGEWLLHFATQATP